jgi:ADP-ribose pyrophosphatase
MPALVPTPPPNTVPAPTLMPALSPPETWLIVGLFLVANLVLIGWLVRWLRRYDPPERWMDPQAPPFSAPGTGAEDGLSASDILGWEYAYIGTTASEAMQDRHQMVNFYLLATGIVVTGVVAIVAGERPVPGMAAPALLWLLLAIGWVYFLKLVQLRKAWYGSALAMNRIKQFYLHHNREFSASRLEEAFKFSVATLPPPGKPGTVFHYSVALVGLISSAAFVFGAFLLNPEAYRPWSLGLTALAVLGGILFVFHLRLYTYLLPSRPWEAPPDDSGMPWVRILAQRVAYRFGSRFRVLEARLQYRRLDGALTQPLQRISFERGDSVGLLLVDVDSDTVLLARQFRYPVLAGLPAAERSGDGARQAWLLEIAAGMQDEGLNTVQVAHKELVEELGYAVRGELQAIAQVYASPGGSSERLMIYLGEVGSRTGRVGVGGGLVAEGEDIALEVLPVAEALARLARGEIQDAKTVIALQYLALRRATGQAAA